MRRLIRLKKQLDEVKRTARLAPASTNKPVSKDTDIYEAGDEVLELSQQASEYERLQEGFTTMPEQPSFEQDTAEDFGTINHREMHTNYDEHVNPFEFSDNEDKPTNLFESLASSTDTEYNEGSEDDELETFETFKTSPRLWSNPNGGGKVRPPSTSFASALLTRSIEPSASSVAASREMSRGSKYREVVIYLAMERCYNTLKFRSMDMKRGLLTAKDAEPCSSEKDTVEVFEIRWSLIHIK